MALALLLGALGYLMFAGASQDASYFVTVAEAVGMEKARLGQARLFGVVAEKGLDRQESALGVAFWLADKDDPGRAIRVEYRGAVPDTFKPGAEVIVEGGFKGVAQVFSAGTLITKCPSKYEKENRGK